MQLPLYLSFIILIILSYMIGSIPFAVITGYVLENKDIRNEGSGNAGATNVYRILGIKAAVFVLIADFLKGFFPVFFTVSLLKIMSTSSDISDINLDLIKIFILLFIILGHAFPLWIKFRGGKGVACSAGGITALIPVIAPVCLIIFSAVLFISRYVSLSSIITALSLPVLYVLFSQIGIIEYSPQLFSFVLIVTSLILILHRKNIQRLIKHEEKKIK